MRVYFHWNNSVVFILNYHDRKLFSTGHALKSQEEEKNMEIGMLEHPVMNDNNTNRIDEKNPCLNIFSQFLQSKRLFLRRDILTPSYIPNDLPHRKKEINNLAAILAPSLRGGAASNVIIYGKPGTGKTVVVKYVAKQLVQQGKKVGFDINFVFLNCSRVDTQYRILQNIATQSNKNKREYIPFTGLPTDIVYNKLCSILDKEKAFTVVVLDEIDKLKEDNALYTLSRMNEELENSKISIIGISNNLNFTDLLDSRVKSSLGEEPMVYSAYDAEQIQDILRQRIELSLEAGVLDEGVMQLCSALCANEHGDARKAIDLFRTSVELAERDSSSKVTVYHVRRAHSKIESDRISETVYGLPSHSKLFLYAVLLAEKENRKKGVKTESTTGELYDLYKILCSKIGMNHLTQRRIADLISELDCIGLLTVRILSRGRKGRTSMIKTAYSNTELLQILQKDEILQEVMDYKIKNQKRLF
jgi:archaeal cell division control protein 6